MYAYETPIRPSDPILNRVLREALDAANRNVPFMVTIDRGKTMLVYVELLYCEDEPVAVEVGECHWSAPESTRLVWTEHDLVEAPDAI